MILGQIDRSATAVGWRLEDVEIGRQRLDPPSLAHREVDEPSIRAPGNFISATKRLGRRVADQLAHHRMTVAARAFGCERQYEQLLALAIGPAVPVTNE